MCRGVKEIYVHGKKGRFFEEKGPKSIVDRLSDWSERKWGSAHIMYAYPSYTSSLFTAENELLLFRKLLPFIVVLIRD